MVHSLRRRIGIHHDCYLKFDEDLSLKLESSTILADTMKYSTSMKLKLLVEDDNEVNDATDKHGPFSCIIPCLMKINVSKRDMEHS